MKISELAKATGVSKHTIRFYERLGMLKSTPIQAGSRQYGDYGENSISAIERIRRMQELGLSLREIKEYVKDSEYHNFTPQELLALFGPKLKELKAKRQALDELVEFIEGKLAERLGEGG